MTTAVLESTPVRDDERHQLQQDFFLSAIQASSRFGDVDDILEWLASYRRRHCSIELIPLAALEEWYVEPSTGNIRHRSGKFFSIEGVRVESLDRETSSWSQPIIHQPEVGILGIVVKKFDGIYHFLMQAKIEPGNIDGYQISPTVQATRSNYTQVHGGKLPAFVELFLERHDGRHRVLADSLQSEEGARFWRKNNLNVLLEVGPDDLPEAPPEFRWMTLHQLKRLLLRPNIVNVCARSVLACVP